MKFSIEHCERMRKARLGVPRPDLVGRIRSEDEREGIRAKLKGRPRSPEVVAKHHATNAPR